MTGDNFPNSEFAPLGAISDVFDKMHAILDWMTNNDLQAEQSRYSEYLDDISNYFKLFPIGADGHQRFEKMTNALIECMNMVQIHSCFQNERSKGFWDRMKKAANGQPHPALRSAGPSRDYLFELLVATRLFMSGYRINFDNITDVVAEKDDHLILAECKRLSSQNKFEKNFKKAGKQLTAATDKIDGTQSGLVIIDVSVRLVDIIPKGEVANLNLAKSRNKHIFAQYDKENLSKIVELIDRFSTVSRGVLLFAQVPIWTSDVRFYLHNMASIRFPDCAPQDEETALEKILAGFNQNNF